MGEIVYCELPDVGTQYSKSDVFGQIESVKAASDLYVPVSGEIIEINDKLKDEPGLINSSPDSQGWMLKIKPSNMADVNSIYKYII